MVDRGWEFDGERRASAFAFALRVYAPVVQFHQAPGNRESQAKPAVYARDRRIGLAKPIEDVWQKLRADSLAGVFDDQFQMGAGALKPRLHAPAPRSEFDRVRDQVQDNLLQPVGVA